jgi:endonuclease III
MADALKNKVKSLLQTLDRRFGRYRPPTFLPPPSSADASAALAVASKNCELVIGAVLGLHGPPQTGFDAARKLMTYYVDWNEVRVSNPAILVRMLGRDQQGQERIALLQRFLEAFFLRQRNLNLDCMVPMRPAERRQFLQDLEVFSREELAALLLTCFGMEMFPPSDALHRVSQRCGLIRSKTTVLQMAKECEDKLEVDQMLDLYSGLYGIATQFCFVEQPKCPACPLKARCPAAKGFARAAKK